MFWIGGRLWEVVAYKGWSRIKVGLYKKLDEIEARQKYQKGPVLGNFYYLSLSLSYSLDLDVEEDLTKVFTCHRPNVVNR